MFFIESFVNDIPKLCPKFDNVSIITHNKIMSFAENLVLELQSGVRKWVLITAILCLFLSYPTYLLSTQLANVWFYNLDINPNKFDGKVIVVPKTVEENEIRLDTSNYVDLSNGKRLIYTFIDNRLNRNLGYFPLYYNKQVIDKNNNVLTQTQETSYLLPGESKYISAYSDNPNAVAITIDKQPNTQTIAYNPNSNPNLKTPDLQIRDKTVLVKDKNTLTLRTSIKNPTNLVIKNVNLAMLVRDAQDSIIGVQDYSFQGLVPNEEREVIVDYPAPKNRTAKSLDVRYSVNYLDPSSITPDLKY
jgi:hypothetical protein